MIELRCNPTDSIRLTSQFRKKGHRKGIDIGAITPGVPGDNLYAINDGVVKLIKVDATGYGNYIVIEHKKKFCSLYAHLIELELKVGQVVKAGQIIGHMGYTGRCEPVGPGGTHLHFEIRKCTYDKFWVKHQTLENEAQYAIDPEPLLLKNLLSMSEAIKIIQDKCKFDQNTINWYLSHPWPQHNLDRLARAMK